MKLAKLLRRFLMPRIGVTAYYFLKFRCHVSPRAEVDVTPNLRLGAGSQISSFCKLKAVDGPLSLGKNVSVATGSFLSAHTAGISVGDYSMIGPNVAIVAGNYIYDDLEVPMQSQGHHSIGIVIEQDVYIGAGAVVLDGSVIRQGSIVTPNSVVSGEIPRNSVVQGTPGKVIFKRR